MFKRRWARLLGLALLVAVGCSRSGTGGEGRTGGPDTPVDGGTLNLSIYSAPKGVFNPILSEDPYDSRVIDLVFNGLLMNDEQLQWICDLCESYTVSEENKTVTFTLKSGLKWHDGQPVTTADVAFTFRAMLHPEYTGARTGEFSALAGVEKLLDERDATNLQVKEQQISEADAAKQKMEAWTAWLNGDGQRAIHVVDERTISFSADEPYAPLLGSLAIPILPEHKYKETEIGKMLENPAVQQPVGTGPYKFVEYKTDQYVKLERNDDYFRGRPHIATIIYRIVDPEVAIGQLKSGKLDQIEIDPASADLLKSDPNVRIATRPDFGYQFMGINLDNPALSDKRVRQAIMYAIDRQAMVDRLFHGYGTIINTHMLPVLWAYDAASLNPYPHNPETARQLLAEAGWQEKNADGYLTKEGEVLQFTLKYPSGNPAREASALLIQANLKDVGIKIDLQMMALSELSTTVFDQRDMDLWLMGWSMTTDPDPGPIFLPNNKYGKATGWTNSRSEQLISEGTKVLRVTERKPIYAEWARILNDELPYVFLYSQNVLDAVRQDRVKGLKPDARGPLWNIWELWIPKAKQG